MDTTQNHGYVMIYLSANVLHCNIVDHSAVTACHTTLFLNLIIYNYISFLSARVAATVRISG